MGLTGHSVSRQKPPEDGHPIPYRDPKSLLPRPCESRSSIPMGGRLRKFADECIGIIHDPFMFSTIQWHLLQFNHKPTLVKPNHKCWVKIPKPQENMMASGVRSVLSKGTIEVGPGNNGFFTYPILIPHQNGKSHFIMNLKPLN